MTGGWTRDDVLVWFTADEWDEITSALRNRAPALRAAERAVVDRAENAPDGVAE